MMHPPTFIEGPLRPHEVSELADFLDDLDAFMTSFDQLPEDLRLRITWWAFRLENTGARR
ncbi:MAG TPA: hypothetical protein VMU64_00075 [Acidimicrobiales bacterium]|nr:hypothetical protein [Acidimicrobiales bacterium]